MPSVSASGPASLGPASLPAGVPHAASSRTIVAALVRMRTFSMPDPAWYRRALGDDEPGRPRAEPRTPARARRGLARVRRRRDGLRALARSHRADDGRA